MRARSLACLRQGRSPISAGLRSRPRKVPESLDLLRRAIELENQFDTGKGSWLVIAQSGYGAALALSGRFDEADRVLQATFPLARESAREDSLALTWNPIGLTRQLQSQWAESERAFREALGNTKDASPNQTAAR